MDFPTITICPCSIASNIEECDPKPYNQTKLDFCGFDVFGKFNGSKCPKTIWKSLTPKLRDFGIIWAAVFYFNAEMDHLSVDENDSVWKRNLLMHHGACYSLKLPRKILDKSVFFCWT